MKVNVVAADPNGITMSTGQRITWTEMRDAASQVHFPSVPHSVARQMDPEGAALEDVYQEFLRQARVLCPPVAHTYHDPCDHAAGICQPLTIYLDVDEVSEENALLQRLQKTSAAITRYREVR